MPVATPTLGPGALTVELIEATGQLEALSTEWATLFAADPAASPFQSPAWLLPWWRHFPDGRLATLACRDQGRLVGLLPLYGLQAPGPRRLVPLGIGISDHLDVIALPDRREAVAAVSLASLARFSATFDRIDLEALRPGSPLVDAPAPTGWRSELLPTGPCPQLALPRAGQPAAGRLAARLARLPYYRRRAHRLGAYRCVTAGSAEASPSVDAMVSLHSARWRHDGQDGVLADPRVQAFHRDSYPELAAAGLVRLTSLWLHEDPVAFVYALARGGVTYGYLSGWAPTLPHPGLGALVLGEAIEAAIANDSTIFDLLRGAEPYKYDWGAADVPSFVRRLTPP